MNFQLTDFFYNTVPGGFFLFIWLSVFSCGTLGLGFWQASTIFVLISVVLGFLFQNFWHYLREVVKIDERIDKKIAKEEGRWSSWSDVSALIMDYNAYLWQSGRQLLHEHFGSVSAFWGNLFAGCVFSVVISIYFIITNYSVIYLEMFILFLVLGYISYGAHFYYREKYRKTIFRQYKNRNRF